MPWVCACLCAFLWFDIEHLDVETRSFNSNCRLFVWVRPYKHTIRPEDYSRLWPQFSSGLLPGSLEVPACKPQSYQNPGRSEPQRTAQPPQ